MGTKQGLADRYCVTSKDFTLADLSPEDGGGLVKDEALARLAEVTERLGELQERLAAQDRWALLVILQGMDAAGKDGLVKHVLSGVNPAGCQVFAFKAPSEEELDHDYLWRAARALPERGRIGIFNRSYYEELVTVRIHPEYLERQRLPARCSGKSLWEDRAEDVRAFERYLDRNGILVRKFFLHVSRAEQKRRFLERIEHPEKNWKFHARDVEARGRWQDYQRRWSQVIADTSRPHAPWFVVPADRKWFARLIAAEVLVAAMEALELDFPRLDEVRMAELAAARRALEAETE
jgi:PPK2 family polyphosphate:nucleotide phosphotransferase